MSVVLPDELVEASGLAPNELVREIVLMLFQQKRISIGKASGLLGINLIEFQHLISDRNIPLHYDIEDLEEDISTLRRLGRL